MFTTLVALTALGFQQAPTIADFLPTGLHDVSFTAKVVKGNERELETINSDFAQAYRFPVSEVKLCDPFLVRIDTQLQDTKVTFIVNGTTKVFRVPRSNLNLQSHVAKKPGQRQTWMDFGVVAPSLFQDLFTAKYVRADVATASVVFDATYQERNLDTSRQRIWIDREKRVLVRREWYDQKDKLKAVFLYLNPAKQGELWFPTRVEVRTAAGAVAGITDYQNVKINAGLDLDLFKIGKP